MNDAAVMAFQKDALTGHRPTWKMGTGKRNIRPDLGALGPGDDPFGLFGDGMRTEQKQQTEKRQIRNAERKALDTARARCRRHPAAGEGPLQGTGETVSTPM